MPEAASRDFDKMVRANGGSISHSPDFPGEFRLMSFTRRLLQNGMLGLVGLICLGIGLDAYRRESANDGEEVEVSDGTRTELPAVVRHLLTCVAVLAVSVVLWMVVLMLQA
jgi:hypothetical protein